jgi:hypothetical protein
MRDTRSSVPPGISKFYERVEGRPTRLNKPWKHRKATRCQSDNHLATSNLIFAVQVAVSFNSILAASGLRMLYSCVITLSMV